MRIYTLTLNPAYDVHVHAEHFVPFHENIATVLSREAGGKGVNLSRGLLGAQVENTAVILMGTDNAADYRKQLQQDGVRFLELENPGSIRENITLHCDNAPETRISFTGFTARAGVLEEIFEAIAPGADTILTMTGRIANGMDPEAVKAFLKKATDRGAKLVLDSRSFTLADMGQLRPWLIKPNQEELATYSGEAAEDLPTALTQARRLFALGIENTMVSLGEKGALLVCPQGAYHAQPPKLAAVSTIGAGDSAIAGFLAATVAGRSPEVCLQTAVAFGSAACLTPGTKPPTAQAIATIFPQVRVTTM